MYRRKTLSLTALESFSVMMSPRSFKIIYKLIKKLPESLISVSGPVRKKLKDFKSLLDTHIPLTRSVSSFASYVCLKIHNLLLQNAEWPPNGECL